MKLRNKLIKTVALDNELRAKISLYTNYKEAKTNETRYVMTDATDIVICNKDSVEEYKLAGFALYGKAETEEELQTIIERAEVS